MSPFSAPSPYPSLLKRPHQSCPLLIQPLPLSQSPVSPYFSWDPGGAPPTFIRTPLSNLQLDRVAPFNPSSSSGYRDPAPLLRFISARSYCLSQRGYPDHASPLISARLAPSPISVRSLAISRQSLSAASPLPLSLDLEPCPSRLLEAPSSPAGISTGPASLAPVSIFCQSLSAHPHPSSPTPGHRARHGTLPPAAPGSEMIGRGGSCRVWSWRPLGRSAGSEGSPPRRGWCRAGGGSSAAGGRGSRAGRSCLPPRLASCRPGPWVSSGAPCPPALDPLPLFLQRTAPGFRSPSSIGGCGASAGMSLRRGGWWAKPGALLR